MKNPQKTANTVVQVSMDKETKKQLDFLTKYKGFDSPAAFIRGMVRVEYNENIKEQARSAVIMDLIEEIEDIKDVISLKDEDVVSWQDVKKELHKRNK
ncbi:hypothetical protein KC669_03415 [Candidatus Dojkabacteria bacterium]|uniref:Uncharacterized protein n=1 Tax=Candidatus Dojkabacteria bacterium TaxID=2099670 RepID=A0A955RM70_9BACT|nr:hypothetical protein [Candidatus Dojkabacteria bacterium]